MHEALQTLAACHQARIYHGDVKPANFMLANPLPEHSLDGELEKCALLCVSMPPLERTDGQELDVMNALLAPALE